MIHSSFSKRNHVLSCKTSTKQFYTTIELSQKQGYRMKKLLFIAVTTALMSTAAMAWVTGKVKRIEIHPTSAIIVMESGGKLYPKQVVSDAEQKKLILTVALTAQARDATVDMLGEAGKWSRIRISNK